MPTSIPSFRISELFEMHVHLQMADNAGLAQPVTGRRELPGKS